MKEVFQETVYNCFRHAKWEDSNDLTDECIDEISNFDEFMDMAVL